MSLCIYSEYHQWREKTCSKCKSSSIQSSLLSYQIAVYNFLFGGYSLISVVVSKSNNVHVITKSHISWPISWGKIWIFFRTCGWTLGVQTSIYVTPMWLLEVDKNLTLLIMLYHHISHKISGDVFSFFYSLVRSI